MKIIVAESQKVIRRLILSCLEKFPYTILKTGDEKGLELLLQQEVDLLILDASLFADRLPSFVSQLQKTNPKTQILVTVYRNESEEIFEKLENEKTSFLLKPFSDNELENKLESLVGEASDLPSETTATPSRHLPIDSLPSIHRHPAMKKAIGFIRHVADSNITVLISGESGVGKEIFSQTLHDFSCRKEKPFVGINCASIPASLLEAELFGYERGAFTGAVQKRMGKFELAQNGTLLLDEISEMDLALQTKLLRVIQEKELYRIGGHQKVNLNVRIIATTNRDLREAVKLKLFREDLYYRLNDISIRIPPLRERTEDIPVLAQFILDQFNKNHPEKELRFTPQAIRQLCAYSWPGNVREMENIIVRTAYIAQEDKIDSICFDEGALNDSGSGDDWNAPSENLLPNTTGSMKEMERQMIYKALETHSGNRVHAANTLGISVRTLRNKLKLYREEGLQVPPHLSFQDEDLGSNKLQIGG